MFRETIQRIDIDGPLREQLLTYCRLKKGEIWEDPEKRHRIAVIDARDPKAVSRLMREEKSPLMINDPPYNLTLAKRKSKDIFTLSLEAYLDFSRHWIENAIRHLCENGHFYLWLGADQNRGFQPLPDIMLLMREFPMLRSRSFITMRNQRGYGTQKNWMSVRQELLYYISGNPYFSVRYTDIPRILRGYYKEVGGKRTENTQRSKSPTIRPGNVWVDLQQVFYRMEENVGGAYAQKPIAASERIITSCSRKGELVLDLFAHSGSSLIAAEKLGRRCFTADFDPIFAELCIRRLERYRRTGKTGWQWENPFPELESCDAGEEEKHDE